ncbi:hypothetical protein V6N13_015981 [Hibiscus sabdariffa]
MATHGGSMRVVQPTTIFVHNLPEMMHWKGLWVTFVHHREVVDAFIPSKRSNSGRWFGFVRYASKSEAERSISRLDGFRLFGSRVSVSFAKFGVRTSYWKKKKPKEKKFCSRIQRRIK